MAEKIEPRGPLSLPPHPQSKNKVQCTELTTLSALFGIDSHEMKDMGSLGDGTGETEQNQRKSFSLDHDGDTQLLDSQQLSLPTSPANGKSICIRSSAMVSDEGIFFGHPINRHLASLLSNSNPLTAEQFMFLNMILIWLLSFSCANLLED